MFHVEHSCATKYNVPHGTYIKIGVVKRGNISYNRHTEEKEVV